MFIIRPNNLPDRSAVILRVYLLGYHVLPILIRVHGTRPWPHLHGCRGRNRFIHLIDYLVSLLAIVDVNLRLTLYPREFCLRHPEVRDVCDIGQLLFWNSRWAWWFTAVMFVLNNAFIQVCAVGLSGLLVVSILMLITGLPLLGWLQVFKHCRSRPRLYNRVLSDHCCNCLLLLASPHVLRPLTTCYSVGLLHFYQCASGHHFRWHRSSPGGLSVRR